MKELSLLLVDEHTAIRAGVRAILESRFRFHSVVEAADGREAVLEAKRLSPDLVVTGLRLPRLSGIAATGEIVAAQPTTRVVILSRCDEVGVVEAALRAGASGYVLKRAESEDLIAAVAAVMQGKSYLSPDIASAFIERAVHPEKCAAGTLGALTSREREVMQQVAEGHSAKEIADNLHISVRTAETHRCRVMRKLGVHKTAGLVRIAIREGLVAP